MDLIGSEICFGACVEVFGRTVYLSNPAGAASMYCFPLLTLVSLCFEHTFLSRPALAMHLGTAIQGPVFCTSDCVCVVYFYFLLFFFNDFY